MKRENLNYSEVLRRIQEHRKKSQDLQDFTRKIVEILYEEFEHYHWIGFYWVRGDMLELGEWKGKSATEHIKISVGQGICGASAVSGRTENIPDVSREPRYLACFPSTRSEVVVPIKSSTGVIGEIDIDSDQLSAFTEEDVRFLESVAEMVASFHHDKMNQEASSSTVREENFCENSKGERIF